MNVLKNAKQRNVVVCREFYTIEEINKYLDSHVFFTLTKKFEVSYEQVTSSILESREVRLFLKNVKELKVIYDREFQCYTNFAVLNDGTYIYIEL